MTKGFDNQLYVEKQAEFIRERIKMFDNKLYLEFGGKLFDDYHASRILPGFDVNVKINLLQEFKEQVEIIFCINANDIEKNKIRADFGITYDMDVLRTIDNIRGLGLEVNSVVITQFNEQPSAVIYRKKLENRGVKTYLHYPIKGYPADIDAIVSDTGYGANDYVITTKPLVVVTAPGPCSGKLATCLSQLYHEDKRGVVAGYAKFETFPVWNLPLIHPVNVAYEAATADLKDVNMIDSFHLEKYQKSTVNYNRDIEVFPIVRNILERISGKDCIYNSPTDMGVNMVGLGIYDDEVIQKASRFEIIRRYYKASCDLKHGLVDVETVNCIKVLMNKIKISKSERAVIEHANVKFNETNLPTVAIHLNDGRFVTGKSNKYINAGASAILNAIKLLADIKSDFHIIDPAIIKPIITLKRDNFKDKNLELSIEETLIALSISASNDEIVKSAMEKLPLLANCEAHSSHIINSADEDIFRKLSINITCEAEFLTDNLFY